MGFMKSLGRGVDAGTQNYVRQRLLAQEREDRQARIESEQQRFNREQERIFNHQNQQRVWQVAQARVGALDSDLKSHDKLIEDGINAGQSPQSLAPLISARNRIREARDAILYPEKSPVEASTEFAPVGAGSAGRITGKQPSVVEPLPYTPSPNVDAIQPENLPGPGENPIPDGVSPVQNLPDIVPKSGDLDASGMIPYINSRRESVINEAVRGLTTTAKTSSTAAEQQLRARFPDISEEEIDRAKVQWEGVADSQRYGQYDSETGMQYDRSIQSWVPAPGIDLPNMTNQQFERSNTLRDDFRMGNAVKMFGAAQAGFEGAREGYKGDDAPGDIALLYGFAKAVAPDDSAVREGEFATMEEAQGWFDRVLNLPLKITEGRRLEPEARRKLWVQLHKIYRARKKTYAKRTQEYAGLATEAGLKPKWVVPHVDELIGGMWSMSTRSLIEKASEGDKDAKIELRERFGVQEGESLVEVLNRTYYRKPK